jgi:hypothetical protein
MVDVELKLSRREDAQDVDKIMLIGRLGGEAKRGLVGAESRDEVELEDILWKCLW